jgi:hypothetical protein
MIDATRIRALGCGHGNRNSVVAAAEPRAFGPANLWSGLHRMVVPNKADPGSSTFRSARTHNKRAAQQPGKQLATTPRPRQDVPQASSSVSHKVTTSRIRDGGDWSGAHHGLITRQDRSHAKTGHTSRRTCFAERRRTRAARHARRGPLTWENIGNTAAGADTEHDGTATARCLVVPKIIATPEKSGTELFASAVRGLLPSVNVHRCYLVAAGMARQTG